MAKGSEPRMSGSFFQDEVSRAALEDFRARHRGQSSPDGLDAGPPARVKRLDRPGGYLLVPIHDAVGLRGIVQLDEQGLSVESSAAIRDPASVFLATDEAVLEAVQTALPNRHGWGTAFLGWRPCRESFDSMRPLWVVPHADGESYVSQSCEVFEVLTVGRGG
jgi:hypothetical protein